MESASWRKFGKSWNEFASRVNFDGLLEQLVVKQLKVFGNKYPEEQICGFAFDCNAAYGQVFINLNTPNHLSKNEQLRFSVGDWAHRQISGEQEEWEHSWAEWLPIVDELEQIQCWEPTEEEEEDYFEDYDEENGWFEETRDYFMLAATKVYWTVLSNYCWQEMNITKELDMICIDHDELTEKAFKRMEFVKSNMDLTVDDLLEEFDD
ncbi:MAG: hypothetical protein GY810_23395 [Aureispira sp.]|nr:hypothetical protein [Aureispira sp.]